MSNKLEQLKEWVIDGINTMRQPQNNNIVLEKTAILTLETVLNKILIIQSEPEPEEFCEWKGRQLFIRSCDHDRVNEKEIFCGNCGNCGRKIKEVD